MESANFEQYEKNLKDNQYLGGQAPTNVDREAYELVKRALVNWSAPNPATFPNTFAWYVLVHKFSETARAAWAGATAAPAKAAKAAPAKKEDVKAEAPKAAVKAEAAKADDDEMDLFGDDDEDDVVSFFYLIGTNINYQAAKEALAATKKAATEVKPVKAGPIAKSLIIYEVKPYDSETDLHKLAAKIIQIEMDGLFWKTEYKLMPIAYGIEKIVIGCVVEDAKVSSDDLQEAIEAFEDEVQSVDILVFNKV